MNPLHLHVGMGKTATTTLQESVFAGHPDICYLGKNSTYKKRDGGASHKGYVTKEMAENLGAILGGAHLGALSFDQRWLSRLPFMRKTYVTRAAKILEQHERDYPSTLVTLGSWEALSGSKHARFKSMLSTLALVNPDLKVLFTIRDPVSWIQSSYLQKLKNAGRKGMQFISFEAWFEQNRKRRWSSAVPRNYKNIKIARELLPTGSVSIVPFELIKTDKNEFFTEISRALGIDAARSIELGSQVHRNKTLTQAQYDFLELNQNKSVSKKERREIFMQLQSEEAKAKVIVPERIINAIEKEAAPINRWLAEATGVDLAALGYGGIS